MADVDESTLTDDSTVTVDAGDDRDDFSCSYLAFKTIYEPRGFGLSSEGSKGLSELEGSGGVHAPGDKPKARRASRAASAEKGA